MNQQLKQTDDDATSQEPEGHGLEAPTSSIVRRCRTLRRSTDDDIQSKYDGLSKSQYYGSSRPPQHWKDKVFRRNRYRNHYKPYGCADELSLSRLSISPVKKISTNPLKPTSTQIPFKENTSSAQATPIKNKMLIHPAKLKLNAGKVTHASQKNDTSKQSSQSFDFASLADQVRRLERDTSIQPKCRLGDWKHLRDTLTPLKSSSELTMSPQAEIENDEFDELTTLSNLSLRTEGLSEAVSQPRLSSPSPRSTSSNTLNRSCSQEAMLNELDFTADELASYFEELVHIPKKMSEMAEMMYT